MCTIQPPLFYPPSAFFRYDSNDHCARQLFPLRRNDNNLPRGRSPCTIVARCASRRHTNIFVSFARVFIGVGPVKYIYLLQSFLARVSFCVHLSLYNYFSTMCGCLL